MKKIVLALVWVALWAGGAGAGIVNNSGSTGEDSTAIEFFLLDTLGREVHGVDGDSLIITTFFPDGGVAATIRAEVDDAKVTPDTGTVAVANTLIPWAHYTYADVVSAFDGGTPTDGVYKWIATAFDDDLDLSTTIRGEFQLYITDDFSTWADSTLTAITDANKANFQETKEDIADQVWDEGISGHNQAATMGLTLLNSASHTGVADTVRDIFGDTLTVPIDSILTAITDANKANFKSAGDTNAFGLDYVVDLVWDEPLTGATHNGATTAGRRLRQASDAGAVLHEGTAQAGGNVTITLAAGASATNDLYHDAFVSLLAGTGVGQIRPIVGYVGATKVATVSEAWATNPDNTTEYVLSGSSAADLHTINEDTLPVFNLGIVYADTGMATLRDSTLNAIEDANKPNFRSSASSPWTAPGVDSMFDMADEFLDDAPHDANYGNTGGIGESTDTMIVLVVDTSNGVRLDGIHLTVKKPGGSTLVRSYITDADSGFTWTGFSGTSYPILGFSAGYVFPAGQSADPADGTDSLLGYLFNPGTPDSANLCRVYGWIQNMAGIRVEDVVVQLSLEGSDANYVHVDATAGLTITDYAAPDTTDSDGYWFLDRVPSILMNGATYHYTGKKGGKTYHDGTGISIPNQSWIRIDSILTQEQEE